MPFTAGQADLTVGPRIAAQGIQSAMGGITDILSKMGMMHLQDQQGGAILDAYKAAGYFDNQPGRPNSSMMPAALYSAAQKGPLGTKFALSQTLQNYLQMNYQMRYAGQRYMMEGGGAANPQGGQGQSQGQRPPPAQNSYDSQNAPPTTSNGMNLQGSPVPPAPQAAQDSEDD
jgi:hypothetical protein